MLSFIWNGLVRNRRVRTTERMDMPEADTEQIIRSLGYLKRLHALSGHVKNIRQLFLGFFTPNRYLRLGRPIRILDVAIGGGDISTALAKESAVGGMDAMVVGVDIHPTTLSVVSTFNTMANLVQGTALSLPFADGSFDVVICSLFLHHLSDDECVTVMKEMMRVTNYAFIISDLLRTRRSRIWSRVISIAANAMVRNDAPASSDQAFTEDELRQLMKQSGMGRYSKFRRQFGHHCLIYGAKNLVRSF